MLAPDAQRKARISNAMETAGFLEAVATR
jgi:hypothetical protein